MQVGKANDNVMNRSVFKQLNKRRDDVAVRPGLGIGAAVVHTPRMAYQVIKSAVMSGDVTELGLMLPQRVITGLLSEGAVPAHMIVDIMMPKYTSESDLKLVMHMFDEVCAKYQMEIIGGHTQFMESVLKPTISVTAMGYTDQILKQKAYPGDSLVMVGYAGYAGASRLARKGQEDLHQKYHPDFIDEAMNYLDDLSVQRAIEIARLFDISVIHEVSEGGIFAALWEVAVASNVGLLVDLKKIPLKQQIVEICDYYDLNPYKLYGQGSLLLATSHSEQLILALHKEGIPAVVIGAIQTGHDKCIQNDDETRYLDMPKGDEIYKVIND